MVAATATATATALSDICFYLPMNLGQARRFVVLVDDTNQVPVAI